MPTARRSARNDVAARSSRWYACGQLDAITARSACHDFDAIVSTSHAATRSEKNAPRETAARRAVPWRLLRDVRAGLTHHERAQHQQTD
jgi:hypothetical protein